MDLRSAVLCLAPRLSGSNILVIVTPPHPIVAIFALHHNIVGAIAGSTAQGGMPLLLRLLLLLLLLAVVNLLLCLLLLAGTKEPMGGRGRRAREGGLLGRGGIEGLVVEVWEAAVGVEAFESLLDVA